MLLSSIFYSISIIIFILIIFYMHIILSIIFKWYIRYNFFQIFFSYIRKSIEKIIFSFVVIIDEWANIKAQLALTLFHNVIISLFIKVHLTIYFLVFFWRKKFKYSILLWYLFIVINIWISLWNIIIIFLFIFFLFIFVHYISFPLVLFSFGIKKEISSYYYFLFFHNIYI